MVFFVSFIFVSPYHSDYWIVMATHEMEMMWYKHTVTFLGSPLVSFVQCKLLHRCVQCNITSQEKTTFCVGLSVYVYDEFCFFAMWCRTYFSARTSGVSCRWSRRRLMTSTSNGERSWTSWTRWKTSTVERISQVREPISSVCNVCCHWMQFCCADIITRTQNVAPAH